MKNLVLLLLTLNISSVMGQNLNKRNDKIQVTSTEAIDLNELCINLSEELGWHTTMIPIFHDGKVDQSHFPVKAGIYNLTMNYRDSLFYKEVVLCRFDPESEKLSFNFYEENQRVFCRITSIQAPELNKEIVLSELDEELKELIDKLDSGD
ncbi:hypothetical protein AB9P05_13770 [Roseivirga sp. BDSF3-8]|uniref:hypothetical protein n=1 Tax=Roseivirga sp. BDSF3-8 TaxID=3241598 RepID=UPI0035325935